MNDPNSASAFEDEPSEAAATGPSRWAPRHRMLWGFIVTGAIVVLVQVFVTPFVSTSVFQMWAFVTPDGGWDQRAIALAWHVVIAFIAGWISWRVLRNERRAGHSPTVIDAAAGPLAVSIIFGVPYAMFYVWFLALFAIFVGLTLSAAGFYVAARWGSSEAIAGPVPSGQVSEEAEDDPPIDWRLMRRRALFLLLGSVIVSIIFVVVFGPVDFERGIVEGGILMTAVLVVLSLPVLWLVLSMFNATPHVTWIRAVGAVALANAILLPFGYWVVGWVYAPIGAGALILGGLIVHPLALIVEQATSKREEGAAASEPLEPNPG